jgi:hypothetical protein
MRKQFIHLEILELRAVAVKLMGKGLSVYSSPAK